MFSDMESVSLGKDKTSMDGAVGRGCVWPTPR